MKCFIKPLFSYVTNPRKDLVLPHIEKEQKLAKKKEFLEHTERYGETVYNKEEEKKSFAFHIPGEK